MKTATEPKQLTPQQLALYLGFECTVFLTEKTFNKRVITGGLIKELEEHFKEFKNDYLKIKIHLRPLSTITKGELNELYPDFENDLDLFLKTLKQGRPLYWESEQIQHLLSKGFDLFGFIESGLAIDKTTLNLKHK